MRISLLQLITFIFSYFILNTWGFREYANMDYKTVDIDYGYDEDSRLPRNLIMMIPDGTSPNVFTMARTVIDPDLKKQLHIDELLMGTVKTYSNTSYITDSASSATAYSCGVKTYDRAIAVDMEKQPLGTILEAAKARNMVVGMIVTSRVTHATPASFASHVDHRRKEDEIASQYVNNKNLDFLLGGGKRHFTDQQIQEMIDAGYTLVENKDELNTYSCQNKKSGKLRLLGLFDYSHMAYEIDRSKTNQPSLSDMVDTIFKILENNEQAKKHGFFVMIEGSRIDHAGHANDPGTMALEAVEFDQSVAVVKEYVANHKNTAMISAADHGTGGMSLGRDRIYAWKPEVLKNTKMSTEYIGIKLEESWEVCLNSTNIKGKQQNPCQKRLFSELIHILAKANNVTEISKEWKNVLRKQFEDLGSSLDVSFRGIRKSVSHIMSEHALIGWSTMGHNGGDVNLYCMGPRKLERMCKGAHENFYVNHIMKSFLSLGLQDETIRLRNEWKNKV